MTEYINYLIIEFGDVMDRVQIFKCKCTSLQRFIWRKYFTCGEMLGLTDCFVDRGLMCFQIIVEDKCH